MQSSEPNNQSSSNNVDMGIDEMVAEPDHEPQPQQANPTNVQASNSDQDLDENLHAPQSLHH